MFSRLIPRFSSLVRSSSSFPRFSSFSTIRSFPRNFSSLVAEPVKVSSYITGVPVIPNGREVLIGLYQETLRLLSGYENNALNNSLRQWTEYRLRIVERCSNIAEVEEKMDFGSQIEEMIDDAEQELDLLVVFNEDVKPWNYQDDSELEPNNGGWAMEPSDMEETHNWPDPAEEAKVWADIDKELGCEVHCVKPPLHGFTGKTWREAIIYGRKNFKKSE